MRPTPDGAIAWVRPGGNPTGASPAEISPWRFRLWRTWSTSPPAVWVLLNPSTANATQDDPTIRRWGYGGIEVVNLWAWRATEPRQLRPALRQGLREPDEAHTEREVAFEAARSVLVVVGWGAFLDAR